jgi:PilZ domain
MRGGVGRGQPPLRKRATFDVIETKTRPAARWSSKPGGHDRIRTSLHTPLRIEGSVGVWCMNFLLTDGHHAKSINISLGGVYFVTSHPVSVGLPVQVLLRMPRRVAGTLSTDRVFTGRVSHIEGKDIPGGGSGVGVEFVCWETPQRAVH